MYKIIIADDEHIIRTGLKEILDWTELGFEIQEVFSDGEEIIEFLEYAVPDVILTDIKMVNISGVEVAKYVSENKLPCKVVLLSGFQEFALAVEAIKYNTESYLLKPVNPDELKNVFVSIRKKLDEEKVTREVTNQERKSMEEMRGILEDQFLEELMFGVISGREYINSRIRILYPHLDADTAGCFAFDVKIRNFDHFIKNVWKYSYDQFEENLKNFLKIYESDYLFRMIYKNQHNVRLLAIQRDGRICTIGKKDAEEAIEAVLRDMEEVFSVQTEYVIQGIFTNMYEIWLCRNRNEKPSKEYPELEEAQLEEQITLMVSNVVAGNCLKAQRLCHSILDGMTGYTARRRNMEINGFLTVLCKALTGTNPQLTQMIRTYVKESEILALPDEAAAQEYCDRVFDYIRMAENREEYGTDNIVYQAKKYIRDNIYRDVSREEVARKLYISPSYLSKLFVKETGDTYLAYVNKTKIDKAMELLRNPGNKSYQIGEKLGYSTPKYFTRLFRMQTGMTPNEYRHKILSIHDNPKEKENRV